MTGQTLSGWRGASYNALQRALSRRDEVNWLLLGLIVLLIAYWIFVRSLERVEGDVVVARYLLRGADPQSTALYPLLPYVSLLVEFFHPRVLRHFIPVALGWWLAVQATVSLIQVLYGCLDRDTAKDFLRRHRKRSGNVSDVPVEVTPQSLESLRSESVLLRVGGPVTILVPGGHAAVTELNGRFVRVLGPGIYNLGHFEYVYNVIDVKPQERSQEGVKLLTRDGIPLTADVHVVFRIDPGSDDVTKDRPYPFSAEAVRRAAYDQSVSTGAPSTWDRVSVQTTSSKLREAVARFPLDQLLVIPRRSTDPIPPPQSTMDGVNDRPESGSLPQPEATEGQGQPDLEAARRESAQIAVEPPQSVRNDTTANAREVLKKKGIKLLHLNISRLAPPEEASRQYVEYWLANWRKRDRIALASGTASTLQEVEVARAEAEINMLQALVEGLRRGQHDQPGADSSDIMLALRLVQTLEHLARQSGQGVPGLEQRTQPLMSRLVQLQEQLQQHESDSRSHKELGSGRHQRPAVPSKND